MLIVRLTWTQAVKQTTFNSPPDHGHHAYLAEPNCGSKANSIYQRYYKNDSKVIKIADARRCCCSYWKHLSTLRYFWHIWNNTSPDKQNTLGRRITRENLFWFGEFGGMRSGKTNTGSFAKIVKICMNSYSHWAKQSWRSSWSVRDMRILRSIFTWCYELTLNN